MIFYIPFKSKSQTEKDGVQISNRITDGRVMAVSLTNGEGKDFSLPL